MSFSRAYQQTYDHAAASLERIVAEEGAPRQFVLPSQDYFDERMPQLEGAYKVLEGFDPKPQVLFLPPQSVTNHPHYRHFWGKVAGFKVHGLLGLNARTQWGVGVTQGGYALPKAPYLRPGGPVPEALREGFGDISPLGYLALQWLHTTMRKIDDPLSEVQTYVTVGTQAYRACRARADYRKNMLPGLSFRDQDTVEIQPLPSPASHSGALIRRFTIAN